MVGQNPSPSAKKNCFLFPRSWNYAGTRKPKWNA